MNYRVGVRQHFRLLAELEVLLSGENLVDAFAIEDCDARSEVT